MLRLVAVEERIFSLNQPQAFFTMFGNVGGAASEDLAMEAFEDDLKLTGRGVSACRFGVSGLVLIKC